MLLYQHILTVAVELDMSMWLLYTPLPLLNFIIFNIYDPDFSPATIFCIPYYLIGSIPFALISTKCFGSKDIRQFGSGNIGATNVLRTNGKTLALSTLILDFAKSFVPLFLIKLNFLDYFNHFSDYTLLLVTGLALILGHIFPIWLRFKGGKGVVTTLGLYFAYDTYLGIIACFAWLFTFIISKYSSLSSIAMVFVVTVASFVLYHNYPKIGIMFTIIGIIVISCHHKNILNLISGNEEKMTVTNKLDM